MSKVREMSAMISIFEQVWAVLVGVALANDQKTTRPPQRKCEIDVAAFERLEITRQDQPRCIGRRQLRKSRRRQFRSKPAAKEVDIFRAGFQQDLLEGCARTGQCRR